MPEDVRYHLLEDRPGDGGRAVRGLLDRVAAADGVEALGEAFVRGLPEDRGHRHVLAETADGRVVGVLAVDREDTAEVAVDPDHRRQGVATGLARTLAPTGGGTLSVWAHGDLAPAQAVARARGARRVRELLKMRVDCPEGSDRREEFTRGAEAAVDAVAAAGLEVLTYPEAVDRHGRDVVDRQWTDVNNEAFAWHPEQGGWDVETLRAARDTAWFRPEGVVMLWSDEPRCLGCHWTKLPEGEEAGEVYVVCLADAARGRGLGGPVTLLGIGELLREGAQAVELYVEGDNDPAVATYRRLGFGVEHADVVYRGVLEGGPADPS